MNNHLDTVIAAYECHNGPVMNQKCEACPYGYTYLIGDENGYPFFTCNEEKLTNDMYSWLKLYQYLIKEDKKGNN